MYKEADKPATTRMSGISETKVGAPVAGGFGSFIRRTNAQIIGLLSSEIEHGKINYVGNASLAGAKWAILSSNARKHAEELARRTEHLELSLDTNFQMEFSDAMIFPS